MPKTVKQDSPAYQNFVEGQKIVGEHPIFESLLRGASIYSHKETSSFSGERFAYVCKNGDINCFIQHRVEPVVWARILAHCLLHLGMNHFVEKEHPQLWNIACDLVVEKFLSDLKFGSPCTDFILPPGINNEERLYCRLVDQGIYAVLGTEYESFGTAGVNELDMREISKIVPPWQKKDWPKLFARGLHDGVH
ncbi:MAG: hypothetical protein LBG78_07910 [Azoarcus sp.]|jgi:hypothetical protein|nr:hypothetical protein [Azoarcus sp.]